MEIQAENLNSYLIILLIKKKKNWVSLTRSPHKGWEHILNCNAVAVCVQKKYDPNKKTQSKSGMCYFVKIKGVYKTILSRLSDNISIIHNN